MAMSGDTPPTFTDEQLVAFSDGELDAATSEAIERALETDPSLANRLEAFIGTSMVLRQTFAPVAAEPVPARLVALVMAGGTPAADRAATTPTAAVPPAQASTAARRGAGWRDWSLPLAACLALVAGLAGYGIGQVGDTRPTGEAGAFGALAAAGPSLEAALQEAADGETRAFATTDGRHAGTIVLRETFRTTRGFCRTYGVSESERVAFGGVSCRADDGWKVEVVTAEQATGGQFAPASGMARAIEAFLEAAEASDPLTGGDVAAAKGAGWRP